MLNFRHQNYIEGDGQNHANKNIHFTSGYHPWHLGRNVAVNLTTGNSLMTSLLKNSIKIKTTFSSFDISSRMCQELKMCFFLHLVFTFFYKFVLSHVFHWESFYLKCEESKHFWSQKCHWLGGQGFFNRLLYKEWAAGKLLIWEGFKFQLLHLCW